MRKFLCQIIADIYNCKVLAHVLIVLKMFGWESAINNIYVQFIFSLIFALEICAVHCLKAHMKYDHGQ